MTESPSATCVAASRDALKPAPELPIMPPPCTQTITGSGAPPATRRGRQMLR
jgi:hypothetical protein